MVRTKANSIIGDRPAGRPAGDFYPTPEIATRALLRNTTMSSHKIWEPACGDGAISKVLIAEGYKVRSSDLYDRGYGEVGVDFLFKWEPWEDVIVTNPPFNLAQEFAQHALMIGASQVFLLLKLSFLEGISRSYFLQQSPLVKVHVFRKRLKMTRNGEPMSNGGMIAFAWFEWRRGWNARPEISWI